MKSVKKYRLLVDSAPMRYTVVMVKQSTKKPIKKSPKVADFEPNKVSFAVAALAAVSLVILGLLAVYA